MANVVLLDLLGGVSLLLWGLHMVHSGFVRAFGSDLRRMLGTALRNRFRAFLAGIAVTALLQSSTATALMAAAFAAGGLVSLVPALAIMLGANVGTALIVQLLSFNVAALAPFFLLAGVIAFRRGGRTRTRDLGRVSVGLGLMLLALHILVDTLAPAESATEVLAFIGPLGALAWLLVRILPDQKRKTDAASPLYLDETAFDTPSVALACAARETLRMGDIVEAMLRQAITALMTDDRKLVAELSR